MTRENAKELLPVIQAFSAGKKVQFLSHQNGEWVDDPCPSWALNTQYRVKPEPRHYWIPEHVLSAYETHSSTHIPPFVHVVTVEQ